VLATLRGLHKTLNACSHLYALGIFDYRTLLVVLGASLGVVLVIKIVALGNIGLVYADG
jgi:hypothetical protein